MHEMSLLNSLFNRIESVTRENNAEKATNIRIQLGGLAHISPEHFDDAKVGTAAEDAELEIFLTAEDHPQAQEIVLESMEVV